MKLSYINKITNHVFFLIMNLVATTTYSGTQFNHLYSGVFASLIRYDKSGNDALKHGLNNMPHMVEFYRSKNVTEDIKFIYISHITIPDDAHVEVNNDRFWTDKIFVNTFWTREIFLKNGFSFRF